MTLLTTISPEAEESLRERTCVVLGGGGFLGIHLCNALAKAGANVRAFGRSRSFPAAIDPRVVWMQGDFTDCTAVEKAVEGQRSVFHLITASVPDTSNRDPLGDLEANVAGTLRALEVMRSSGVEKVLFTSSGGTVYGIPAEVPIPESAPTEPISAYGIGKLTIEKYLALYDHLYGLKSRILRISNPYGRYQSSRHRQGVVGTMLRRAVEGRPLEIWGDGAVTRDFIHVSDVASAIVELHAYEGQHRVFNIGSEVGMSINDIASSIETVLDQGQLERIHLQARAADVPVNILSTARIRDETEWKPQVSWKQGLADTFDWIQSESPSAIT